MYQANSDFQTLELQDTLVYLRTPHSLRIETSYFVRRSVSKVVRIALLVSDNSTATIAIFTAVTHWGFSECAILQANSSLYLQGL